MKNTKKKIMKRNKKKNQVQVERRKFIANLFLGAGAIGMRSFLLGLPPAFLSQRAIAATGKETFLIFSTRQASCPINANVPYTYDDSIGIEHPADFATPVNFMLGSFGVAAAAPWADLAAGIRNQMQFFHYMSQSNAHPESIATIKGHGGIKTTAGNGTEMLPSAIAQETAEALGTLTSKPMILDTPGFSISYNSISQGVTQPGPLKNLFASGTAVDEKAMMDFRDSQLDLLYKDLKANGTAKQKSFLDSHAISKDQARQLSGQLGTLLEEVVGNNANRDRDQLITAAAVIASKSAPVVVVSLNFGNDNHQDANLNAERDSLIARVADLNDLYSRLSALGIEDKTTFALQNTFGRTLQRNTRGGRDHNSEHAVMPMFGPNVNPGVTGRLQPVAGRKLGGATVINSNDGTQVGADIARNETLGAACKTLMAACGVSDESIQKRVTSGKVVKSAIKPT